MTFSILDYIEELSDYGNVKEYTTWIRATCPVCQGKLTINKHNGAYACWTNNCHEKENNLIRKKLYRYTPFHTSSAFKSRHIKQPRLVELITAKGIDASPTEFLSPVPFNPPQQKQKNHKSYTYFDYPDFQIVRVDSIENDLKVKSFYPQYLGPTGEYITGLPETYSNLPIYRPEYIQPSILFIEGEKCAAMAQQLGLAAITLPIFLFSERYLDRCISKLVDRGVRNVLYLEDNDEPGKRKAAMVTGYFWKYGVGAKSVNLANIFPECVSVEGFDIVDAYQLGLIKPDNILEIMEQCIWF